MARTCPNRNIRPGKRPPRLLNITPPRTFLQNILSQSFTSMPPLVQTLINPRVYRCRDSDRFQPKPLGQAPRPCLWLSGSKPDRFCHLGRLMISLYSGRTLFLSLSFCIFFLLIAFLTHISPAFTRQCELAQLCQQDLPVSRFIFPFNPQSHQHLPRAPIAPKSAILTDSKKEVTRRGFDRSTS